MSNPTYSVLNSYATSDISEIVARKFNVTGTPVFDFIHSGAFQANPVVAEVLQVSTVTTAGGATPGNNTTFSFTLKQVIDGILKSSIISYTSDSTATNAEINAAFAAQISANGFKIGVGSAVNVSTLTAQAGYPIFQIGQVSNVTVATSPAGVIAVGTTAKVTDLVAGLQNTYTVSVIASTAGYVQYVFKYATEMSPSMGVVGRESVQEHWLFVNQDDADAVAFNTALVNVMQSQTKAGVDTVQSVALSA